MVSNVLISVRPGRTRAALVENGVLVDVSIFDDTRPSLVGNIYLGRVEKVLKSLSAAFVDLGGGISGFLSAAELGPPGAAAKADISSTLTEGQAIVVQVQRDGFEDKGPKLTARVTVGGRAQILTPDDPGVRVSRRINDTTERTRLETLAQGLALPGQGFVLRTAAQGISAESFSREVESLRQDWADITEKSNHGTPPALLFDGSVPLDHILRDFTPGDVDSIIIDDTTAMAQARSWCAKVAPDLTDRLVPHTGPDLLFDSHEAEISGGGEDSVEVALDEALSPGLKLRSGGSVLFSETPALVAMDVNAGGAARGGKGQTDLATNLEAVQLIARQIRLRNLSGLLVVDFISSKNKKDQAKVLDALKRAVADDPAQVFVGGFTRFGLMEMTRRRTRPALSSILMEPCAPCEGQGRALSGTSAAYRALDRLARESDLAPADQLSLVASPTIASALQGPAGPALAALNNRFGRTFKVVADPTLANDGFDIVRNSDNDR